MQSVAPATATELFELQSIRRVLFVLRRYVVALFALCALQNNVISWHKSLNNQNPVARIQKLFF